MRASVPPISGADFVLHSLRHTILNRLGESGVDAFTIMRIAGHSSIVVSQRYVHPTQRQLNAHLSGCSFMERARSSESLRFSLHSAILVPSHLKGL